MSKEINFIFYYLIVVRVKFVLCVTDEYIWHSYQFGTGYGNREELFITDVVSDEKINLPQNVTRWKSITTTNRNYAVGLMAHGVSTVIAELSPDKESFVTSANITEFKSTFVDLELFGYWNESSGKQEVILIIATSDSSPELLWFRINEHKLQHFWTWRIHKNISHLRCFKMEDENYKLLMINGDKEDSTVDVYDFMLRSSRQEFWFSQTLQLFSSANNSALNTYASDLYLSIPQKDLSIVMVYKLVENRFQLYQNISSYGVNQVCSFKIGFKSFLAIAGENAGIYTFTKNDIIPQRIDGTNLYEVDFWFPISVRTYRDDVILIMQRFVYHGSHKSFFLEAVLYDGEKFIGHEEIPCSFYGEKENGLACIVDEEGDQGLSGATVLSLGNILGILVPRKEISVLFMIHSALKKLKSPVELEIETLLETKKRLQEMITQQHTRIDDIQNSLRNSLKLDEPDEITSHPKFQTPSAPILQEKLNISSPVVSDNLNSEVVNIKDLQNEASKIRRAIDSAKNKLLNSVPLNRSQHHFEELIVDGEIQVRGESKFRSVIAEKLNDEPVNEAFNDLVRKSNTNPVSGPKTFTDLQVENITLETFSGMKADNIIPDTNKPVIVNGSIVFVKPLHVVGDVFANEKVNDYYLKDVVVEMNNKYKEPLEFEHIKVNGELNVQQINNASADKTFGDRSAIGFVVEIVTDEVEIAGNIVVEHINGENFDEFKKSLCLMNVATHIPGEIIITGELNIEKNATTKTLNDLRFPEDYILRYSSKRFAHISGNKIFESPVYLRDIITRKTINGLDPRGFVSLTQKQTLPGVYIFNDLEVSENLNVDGDIIGQYADDFLPNPVLPESNEIKANVIFKNLEVEGTITVGNNFSENNFEELLNDVIYTDENEVVINSIKDFPRGFLVNNGLNIASNKINNVPLTSFITTDSNQVMEVKTLNGPVSFENLILGGLYGDVNITKLDEETVKLTGEQHASSTLVFINNNDKMLDMSATDFHIAKTLNNVTSNDYYYTSGDRSYLENSINLDNLRAQNVFIQGDLLGSITGFSLENFDEKRLSLTRDQVVTAPYTVRNLESDNLKTVNFNEEAFDKLFNYRYFADKVSEMLFKGKLQIKNLHVNGSIALDYVNGKDFREFLKDCVWRNKNNNFKTAVFEGDVVFGNLNLSFFNGVDFKLFSNNIVFKTEINPVISGVKTFIDGFRVTRMLNSEHLNHIHVDNILTKTGTQQVGGPLNIYGNVLVNGDSEIFENLNGVPMDYLRNTYKFDNRTCIINDDIVFDRLQYVDQLYVDGFIGEEIVEEFLQNIVYKSENVNLEGNIEFENFVIIHKDLVAKKRVNNLDLSELIQDMVFITSDDLIERPVTFTQPVYVEQDINIDSNLNTQYLLGIDLDFWNENAVFINRGLIHGKLTFESVTLHGDLLLNFVNNVDLNSLIPLQTTQYINQSLSFVKIKPFHHISVKNYVNGLKLENQLKNSLLTTQSSQQLLSVIIFSGNVLVRNNLDIFGLVNGRNFSQIVTTNTEQNLTALYKFNARVKIDSNLYVNGLVNGIDISEWEKRSVKTYTEYPQNIYDNWLVDGNITFFEDVVGGGSLSGINVQKMADDVEEKRLFKYSTENALLEDYINICKDVNEVIDIAENQIYLFKYLESLETLQFYNDIGYVHYFKYEDQSYLLINEKDQCTSYLYVWLKSHFQLIKQLETGKILQFISVFDGDLLFLVSRNDVSSTDCEIDETNIWKFEVNDVVHLYKLEEYQILEESLTPGTFYALSSDFVTEFKLITVVETTVKVFRKWIINSENLVFVPRGFATGLALSNGNELYRLIREDPVIEDDYGYETEAYIIGNVEKEYNPFLPGYSGGDVLVINVGADGRKRSLVGVASHEETSVKGRLDFIKIFEDIRTGRVFHKVPAYKPSSLISLEFDNSGETLLIFLEDKKILQVYEYKGIEGFKHRLSMKLEGSKLLNVFLSTEFGGNGRNVIGVINKNKITFMQAIMTGNQLSEDRADCEL